MQIFPNKNYFIELNTDSFLAIAKLKKETFPKDQFNTNSNRQVFIGKVQKNAFEIMLSKKIVGKICILKGKLEKHEGILEINTTMLFKIIFVVLVLFAFSGIVTAIIQKELELIFHLVMAILVMRYLFLEVWFRIISKIVINKLSEIIGIKKLHNKDFNN